ncbi:MAG: alpha/beta hydrolase [Bdellovibrionaceae bacterium]|nr:alpha/beta hydrolase [Pseudobdellovibrionaceae bacterium]
MIKPMLRTKYLKSVAVVLAIILVLFIRLIIIDQAKKNDLAKTALAYETFGKEGERILLLHGILGSHRYWTIVADKLSQDHFILAPDLLGFGDSPKPYLKYTVSEHLVYLDRTVSAVFPEEKKFFIIGHSMGAILALNDTIKNPDRIQGLVLINPPILTSHNDLENDIKNNSSKMMAMMTFNKTWGGFVCRMHEVFPAFSYPFLLLLEPDLPSYVAMDATKHTYESFSGSLENVLQNQNFFKLIDSVKSTPILVISTKDDAYSKQSELEQLKKYDNIRVRVLDGDHNFILKTPDQALIEIKKFLKDHE